MNTQTMSAQNQLAKLVFDFWYQRFPDQDTYVIVTDQGKKWGAPKPSPARTQISLYTRVGDKGRDTQMARADVGVINLKQKRLPYLVEIEVGKHIKPKIPAGLIGATNMCRWYFPSYDYEERYDLSGAVLFVLLCSEYLGNPSSKKTKQLSEFESEFRAADGCLNRWFVCGGHDVPSTFNEFVTTFQKIATG